MELLRLRLESRGDEPGSGLSIKDILYPHSSLKDISKPLGILVALITKNYLSFLRSIEQCRRMKKQTHLSQRM
jgi:hypothetical protein